MNGSFPQVVQWNLQPSGPFVALDAGPLQARVYEATGHLELAGPSLAGALHANLIRIAPSAVLTAGGVVSVGELLSHAEIPNGLELRHRTGTGEIIVRLTFPHVGVLRYEVTDWGSTTPESVAIAVASGPDEHFYGFGERFVTLDQAGRMIRTLTFDDPGVKNDHAYKVAPWFVSNRGYGFHLLSAAESTFDLRSVTIGRYVVTNLSPNLTFQLVYGPRLTDVLTRFTGYTGRPPLPPPFAFGPWISSDIWRSGGEVRYAVQQFRKRDIPVSAFVFDSPWEVAYNDFRFNMTQFGRDANIDGEHHAGFGSVVEMMEFLQQNGLKVICWMTPFINTSSIDEKVAGQNLGKAANYDVGAAGSFFVRQSKNGPPLVVPWWKGHGSPIDFTNPAARTWLADQLRTLLKDTEVTTRSGAHESAIGGWKTDDGESGNGHDTYIPLSAHYADGRTGSEMRNAYCVAYQQAVWEVLGTRGILFARSGFVGSPSFPGSWAGDNEPNFGDNGLPSVIVAGQSAAMSGYPIWGHDVGGYQDRNFSASPADLFMRWAQFGCFSPIMQMHRQVQREMQYPWRYGEPALENFRAFARLHTQLFPYIYTYAQQAGSTGVPIIRPLVLLAPDDPNTFLVRYDYHFGDELLVAPFVEVNATRRQLYLPPGDWFNYWTHDRHAGGQTITWTDPDRSHLPLFVRGGGIVPMLLSKPDTLCDANYVNNPAIRSPEDGLRILVFPKGTSAFTIFDGTKLGCASAATATQITFSARPRPMRFDIRGDAMPQSVTLDGTVLAQAPTEAAFEAADLAWIFNAQTRMVSIKCSHAGGDAEIQVHV
jgi:alpha-D-xyloside xylohydrolase